MSTPCPESCKADRNFCTILLIGIVCWLIINQLKEPVAIVPAPPIVEPPVVVVPEIKWTEYCDINPAETRLIWLYFDGGESCRVCTILKDVTYQDDTVRKMSVNFLCVRVTNQTAIRAYGSAMGRSTFIYMSNGKPYIQRLRGVRDLSTPTSPRELVNQFQEVLDEFSKNDVGSGDDESLRDVIGSAITWSNSGSRSYKRRSMSRMR